MGLEWREEGRLHQLAVGRADRPYARVDHCHLLDCCLFCRVRIQFYSRSLLSTNGTSSIYYLYIIVRRPRLILDFAFTLIFNHLVLTTYFSASIPTSLFMYGVMLAGAAITVVAAEQLCVKREMREGLKVSAMRTDEEEGLVEDLELGNLRRD
jgi:Integral membrane protein S linking to the trans Golgi network